MSFSIVVEYSVQGNAQSSLLLEPQLYGLGIVLFSYLFFALIVSFFQLQILRVSD